MGSLAPRAVLVTRETDFERLVAAHATRDQASFFLASRGQKLEDMEANHDRFSVALRTVRESVPDDWRIARVKRSELDRFIFAPEDVVVAVGQDGLVANLAKYLGGQPVLGVNPDPERFEGVLVPLRPDQVSAILSAALAQDATIQARTMACATLDDGQSLCALNEIFVGHRSHQSARYRISLEDQSETQSSSGVIVATGTGATGWARSIMTATGREMVLEPTERALAFFVREPWPSVSTSATITAGRLSAGHPLTLLSNMNDGGVVFADGMEQDYLGFDWGRSLEVTLAERTLNLVHAK